MTTTRIYDHEAQRLAAIERVEADLLSGRYFTLIERSNRSTIGYRPMVSGRSYGGALKALATFVDGDWSASIAAAAVKRINAYGNANEVVAAVAESIAKSVHDGWYDVAQATGPEASRPSAHQHPTTLRKALLLALLMCEVKEGVGPGALGTSGGVGWVITHLLEREGMTIPRHLFPLTAARYAA